MAATCFGLPAVSGPLAVRRVLPQWPKALLARHRSRLRVLNLGRGHRVQICDDDVLRSLFAILVLVVLFQCISNRVAFVSLM